MTSGIIAVLDAETQARVQAIWDEFQDVFGVHGVSITPYPHFSFHVAEHYERAKLEMLIAPFSRQLAPLTVKTGGLGLFTGDVPVIHIPVVRDNSINTLHETLFPLVAAIAENPFSYYEPTAWMPHITLAQHDIPNERIPEAIALLQSRNFNWTIQVEALALLHNHSTEPDIIWRLNGE